jgi:hypothetical protein
LRSNYTETINFPIDIVIGTLEFAIETELGGEIVLTLLTFLLPITLLPPGHETGLNFVYNW